MVLSIFQADDEAARLAHVDHLAVLDESAAVARGGHRHDQIRDVQRTALVHGRGVLDPFALDPVAQLVHADYRGAAGPCARDEIVDVIAVPMRRENQVDLRGLLEGVRARRIVRQPGVQ